MLIFPCQRRDWVQRQRAELTHPDFSAMKIDPILYRLVNRDEFPDFEDPRKCLVFWARPTRAIKTLIKHLQDELRKIVPSGSSHPDVFNKSLRFSQSYGLCLLSVCI